MTVQKEIPRFCMEWLKPSVSNSVSSTLDLAIVKLHIYIDVDYDNFQLGPNAGLKLP